MVVQLNIEYEKLLELVEQLSEEQQKDLLLRLLEKTGTRELSREEKKSLFHANILSAPMNEEPSARRVDWYGDDGR